MPPSRTKFCWWQWEGLFLLNFQYPPRSHQSFIRGLKPPILHRQRTKFCQNEECFCICVWLPCMWYQHGMSDKGRSFVMPFSTSKRSKQHYYLNAFGQCWCSTVTHTAALHCYGYINNIWSFPLGNFPPDPVTSIRHHMMTSWKPFSALQSSGEVNPCIFSDLTDRVRVASLGHLDEKSGSSLFLS